MVKTMSDFMVKAMADFNGQSGDFVRSCSRSRVGRRRGAAAAAGAARRAGRKAHACSRNLNACILNAYTRSKYIHVTRSGKFLILRLADRSVPSLSRVVNGPERIPWKGSPESALVVMVISIGR